VTPNEAVGSDGSIDHVATHEGSAPNRFYELVAADDGRGVVRKMPLSEGGLRHFRVAAKTPFHMVIEARAH